MKDFDLIVPHKVMSDERAAECNKIMVDGNSAFKRWEPFYSRRHSRSCRQAVIKGNLNEVLQYIPTERRVEFLANVPAILAVESVIEDVTGHYVKMVARLAHRWATTNKSNYENQKSYIDGGDLASEGFLSMFDVIRNYDRPDIRFMTYAWTSVNRRMFAAILETAPIACFNRREQKLFRKVVQDQLTAGRPVAEIVNESDLSEEDAAVVREMLTLKVVLASKLERGFTTRNTRNDVFDYTSFRVGCMNDTRDQPNDAWELYDFIERARLSDFEEDALLSSMSPVRGWQAECATRHKHPQTGNNFSRTSVSLALERACSKIRKVAGLGEAKINLAVAMKEAS